MALPLQRLDFSVADILLYQSMGVVWPKVLRRLVCRFFSIIFAQIKKHFTKVCGKFRLGHFEAVADVIDRFIKIIKPRKIYFGEKDMQQLKIIEHFVKKNKIKTKVIGCKTIREKMV